MRSWYLLYSKPRQERLALENLERQRYEAYLPLIRTRRRRQGRFTSLVEPMFPRYLFIHLSEESDNWAPIRSTIGVANLVRFGPEAARVPDDLVITLREREDETGIQVIQQPDFRPGDRVRICEGVMAGYEAIFQARTGKERVTLLLEIAGKMARIQVDAGYIEALHQRWFL
jgi:transcriptional antiterminator RfaH